MKYNKLKPFKINIMKNMIIIAVFIFSFANVHAQANYMQAMGKAMQEMGQAQGPDGLIQASANFERIANVETNKWEPAYWAALNLLNASYMVDGKKNKDNLLDKADIFIDQALKIAPTESEVVAIKGYLYQARIGADGSRGAFMSQKAASQLEKAKELNPENPRAYFLLAQNIFYTPKFFGGGAKKALPVYEEAAAKFKNFHSDNPFAPDWGEEMNQEQLEICKKAEKE